MTSGRFGITSASAGSRSACPGNSSYVCREGPFPTPTAAQLAKFETRHSLKLPESYRTFLTGFAGGPPEGCGVRVRRDEEFRVSEVYPLRARRDAEGISSGDLEGVVNWDEFFPRDLLAFADDGCGNWFCIGIRGRSAGKVFFVDHEYEQGAKGHLLKLADSFDAFRRMWKVPKPPPPR